MVVHTIYATFVINTYHRSIIKSSDFVVEVYMCFLVIYCFSRGAMCAMNSAVIVR